MTRAATANAPPTRRIEDARYHVRPGYRIKAADAETIARAILDVAGDGNASPSQIVEAARPATSPLHRFFEWDDRIAAERHRLARAQYLVGAIEIVISYEGGESESVRALHSVVMAGDDGDERGYASAGVVFGRKELRAQIVEAARRELEGWQARYARYGALADAARMVAGAIRKLEAEAGGE